MGKAHSRLDQSALFSLQCRTHFEKKEILSWHDHFLRQHPTGYITKQTLADTYQQYYPYGCALPFVEALFRVIQPEVPEQLSFQEFMAALSITARGTLEEKLDWAFRFYDQDADDLITVQDVQSALEAIRTLVGPSLQEKMQEPAELFRLMDLRSNGQVDKATFKEAAKLDPLVVQALILYDGVL
jgi:Ca2+-binding EF-hand superfamily protein